MSKHTFPPMAPGSQPTVKDPIALTRTRQILVDVTPAKGKPLVVDLKNMKGEVTGQYELEAKTDRFFLCTDCIADLKAAGHKVVEIWDPEYMGWTTRNSKCGACGFQARARARGGDAG